jgi:RNA polymerase sigma factor (sigma-70 family)
MLLEGPHEAPGMSTQRLRSLLHSLRLAAGRGGEAVADADLLRRWCVEHEEVAFEVLVWRHGPLVLGVCRRVLSGDSDVEDAFQAVFLTLARKAASVRDGASLAAWLHRVAWRVALRARRSSCQRHESPLPEDVPGRADADRELAELLDAEIDRLPERYRRPVVLCLLEGHSQPEAARLLGVPVGTLSSLLCRGRERLRQRLARHGLGAPAETAPAALPAGMVASAVRLALSPTPDAIPARVAELASGVITEMARQKLLTAWGVVLAVAVLLAGGSLPLFESFGQRGKAADAKKADPEPNPTLVDPLDGKLRLKWQIVRPDESHYSLKKNKGKLTIITQKGTIHQDAEHNGNRAKNIFVVNNPFARGDFEVSVCVSGFTPKQYYQQGGLILYDDDDNYFKFTYEYNATKNGPHLVMLREVEAKSQVDTDNAPDSKTVWLRITRRGQKYEFASSGDGKKWTANGAAAWREKGPPRVGLIAKNGGIDGVPEVDVCFDSFRLRRVPPKDKEKYKE